MQHLWITRSTHYINLVTLPPYQPTPTTFKLRTHHQSFYWKTSSSLLWPPHLVSGFHEMRNSKLHRTNHLLCLVAIVLQSKLPVELAQFSASYLCSFCKHRWAEREEITDNVPECVKIPPHLHVASQKRRFVLRQREIVHVGLEYSRFIPDNIHGKAIRIISI